MTEPWPSRVRSAASSSERALGRAPDEREVVRRAAGLALRRRADDRRLDEAVAVLDPERLERALLEACVGPVEDGTGRHDLARLGALHEASAEVDRVADDGEPVADRRTDEAGVDATAVHADAQGHVGALVDDLADRAQQALVVVAGRRRHAAGQHQADGVGGVVAAQELRPPPGRGLVDDVGHPGDEPVQGVRAVVGEDVVGAVDRHEADGALAVLAGRIDPAQLALRGRHERGEVGCPAPGRRRGCGRRRRDPCGGASRPIVAPSPEHAPGEALGECRADHGLAGIGDLLAAHHVARVGAADDELAVATRRHEERERAGAGPGRHPQASGAAGARDERPGEGVVHVAAPGRGTHRVVRAVEPDEQPVAHDLEGVATVGRPPLR